jgi:hypothetical protein
MLLVCARGGLWELSGVGLRSPVAKYRNRAEVIRLACSIGQELGEPVYVYDEAGRIVEMYSYPRPRPD